MNKTIRWLRQLRSFFIPMEQWCSKNTALLAWLALLPLIPASFFSVKLSLGKSELSVAEVLAATILPALTVIMVVLLVAKQLDMLTRSIGGLKLSDLNDLSKPTTPYSLTFATEADIAQIASFADEQYLGTMPAGAGPLRNDRLQNRTEFYRRIYEGFNDSFCLIYDASGKLAGFTLIYPLNKLAIDRYLNGTLAYTDFEKCEMKNDGDGAVLFICNTLATYESIADQEKRGFDLLGQVVVRHIAHLKKSCNFSKLRIVTFGLGYRGNKAFRKKGFVKHRTKDRDGLHVLILDEHKMNEAGREFLKVVAEVSHHRPEIQKKP